MITENSGVFHLQNETASYLLRVRPEGFLEHLHFGTPVYTEDAQALAVRSGLGWGDSVQFDERITPPALMCCRWNGAARGAATTAKAPYPFQEAANRSPRNSAMRVSRFTRVARP